MQSTPSFCILIMNVLTYESQIMYCPLTVGWHSSNGSLIMPLSLHFLICQILLHHTTNLAVGIEMLSHRSLFVERSPYLLGSASNGAIGCGQPVSYVHGHGGCCSFVPLNILPTAPSLENMLVPVPCVLSPADGFFVSAKNLSHAENGVTRTIWLTDSWTPLLISVSFMAEFAPCSKVLAV